MFKKIKTVMMIMIIVGVTVMFSTGWNNASDSGGGSSSSLNIEQPILKSANGSTLTITHDNPKDVVSGSFSIELVEADKRAPFTFSEKQGTWVLGNGSPAATLTLPSDDEAYIYCTYTHYFDLKGGSFPYINKADLISKDGNSQIYFRE